jgi:hypothetical protein
VKISGGLPRGGFKPTLIKKDDDPHPGPNTCGEIAAGNSRRPIVGSAYPWVGNPRGAISQAFRTDGA